MASVLGVVGSASIVFGASVFESAVVESPVDLLIFEFVDCELEFFDFELAFAKSLVRTTYKTSPVREVWLSGLSLVILVKKLLSPLLSPDCSGTSSNPGVGLSVKDISQTNFAGTLCPMKPLSIFVKSIVCIRFLV